MSSSTRPKVLSYIEAAHGLVDRDVQKDVENGCRAYARSLMDILDKFESISKMVHSIDMLGLTVPLRPRWDSLHKVCSHCISSIII